MPNPNGGIEPERAAAIAAAIAALTAVWLRNPNKSLMKILSRSLRDVNVFDPFDASDQEITAGLDSIAHA